MAYNDDSDHTIYPVAEDRLERDGKVAIWENDVPDHREMFGEDLRFICPNPDCGDEIEFLDFEDRDQFVAFLEGENGTYRCGGCAEPIYGIFGDGDDQTG